MLYVNVGLLKYMFYYYVFMFNLDFEVYFFRIDKTLIREPQLHTCIKYSCKFKSICWGFRTNLNLRLQALVSLFMDFHHVILTFLIQPIWDG